jgi:hypothetical protein
MVPENCKNLLAYSPKKLSDTAKSKKKSKFSYSNSMSRFKKSCQTTVTLREQYRATFSFRFFHK